MDDLSRRIKRHFLPLLIGCYFLAWLAPTPGIAISEPTTLGGSLQTLLLAVALFLAALTVQRRFHHPADPSNEPSVSPPEQPAKRQSNHGTGHQLWRAVSALLGLRLGMLALATFLLSVFHTNELLLGIVFVLCMPIAFSSIPWTQKTGGDVRISLRLLSASIVIAPLNMAFGFFLASLGTRTLHSESSTFLPLNQLILPPLILIGWFVVPVLAGSILGKARSQKPSPFWQSFFTMIPPLIILVVNYGSASRVIPQVEAMGDFTTVAQAAFLALMTLLVATFGSSFLTSRLRVSHQRRMSFLHAGSMFNTGMALVLVTTWQPDAHTILIPILMVTLGQHFIAAIRDTAKELADIPLHCVSPRTMATSPVSINKPR